MVIVSFFVIVLFIARVSSLNAVLNALIVGILPIINLIFDPAADIKIGSDALLRLLTIRRSPSA